MANVETALLQMVQATAVSNLKRAMDKQQSFRAAQALKEVVEASLPNLHMPSNTIDTVYRKTGGPHAAWKWVSAKGMLTLLVEVPRGPSWNRIVVSAFVTYPGITKTPRKVYHSETDDVSALSELVHQAAREFERL